MARTVNRRWERDETLAAFNFYLRTPFGRLHARNPEVIGLANFLGRSPGAVAMKCCNLAALDPTLQARGITGLSGISALDRTVWAEFHSDPERVGYESEVAFSKAMNQPPRAAPTDEALDMSASTDREAIRKVRITQNLFRAMILAGYSEKCAICMLPARELLVASHIVAWSIDASNRMNPRNGICLCSIHDRAFDTGLIDVDEQLKIHVTSRCRVDPDHRVAKEMIYRFHGSAIELPYRWQPDPLLLRRRRELLKLI